mmetsp:Transcript_6698/g.13770  ORF Transcript_6698/g.13770 Transcript_6698/m.13770 type:complete len:158 (+) Transcript_6698:82-555(+)
MSTIPDFSLDLVAASKNHLEFLQKIHSSELNLKEPSSESFRRYETLWLPLLVKAANKREFGRLEIPPVVPPLDVAWLWHCHRLAPRSYAKACRELLSAARVLDCPETAFQGALQLVQDEHPNYDANTRFTMALWEEAYPNEAFFLSPTDEFRRVRCG